MEQQLAAILHADVVSYSQLTKLDEENTYRLLRENLDLLTVYIEANKGKKIKEAGDAILAEFQSVTSSIKCAIEFQQKMAERIAESTKGIGLDFRIGVHVGEVIHDRDDIYGDGVNLAARIEGLAKPGGICISSTVYEQVHNKFNLNYEDLGYQKLKNMPETVRVYAINFFDSSVNRDHGLFGNKLFDKVQCVTGGCLCGEIRYEAEGEELGSAYCHCRMCQRFTGSPATVGTGIRKKNFRITKGKPKTYVSSKIAERAFCPVCGSSLWMIWPNSEARLDWIFIHTVSLDEPQNISPVSHTGIESQLHWHEIHDDLPRQRCEDSPPFVEAWEAAGVTISDYPRNVTVPK